MVKSLNCCELTIMHIDGGDRDFCAKSENVEYESNERNERGERICLAMLEFEWKSRKFQMTCSHRQIISPWLDGIVDGATDLWLMGTNELFYYLIWCVRWSPIPSSPVRRRCNESNLVLLRLQRAPHDTSAKFIFSQRKCRDGKSAETIHISLQHLCVVIIQNIART